MQFKQNDRNRRLGLERNEFTYYTEDLKRKVLISNHPEGRGKRANSFKQASSCNRNSSNGRALPRCIRSISILTIWNEKYPANTGYHVVIWNNGGQRSSKEHIRTNTKDKLLNNHASNKQDRYWLDYRRDQIAYAILGGEH